MNSQCLLFQNIREWVEKSSNNGSWDTILCHDLGVDLRQSRRGAWGSQATPWLQISLTPSLLLHGKCSCTGKVSKAQNEGLVSLEAAPKLSPCLLCVPHTQSWQFRVTLCSPLCSRLAVLTHSICKHSCSTCHPLRKHISVPPATPG